MFLKNNLLIFRIIFFFTNFIYFTGCVKEISLQSQDIPPILTLNGVFKRDDIDTSVLRVTYSGSPYDTVLDYPQIAVAYFYQDNLLVGQSEIGKKGYCGVPAGFPREETQFSVKVVVPGRDTLMASDTIPARSSISTATFLRDLFQDKDGYSISEAYVRFKDQPNLRNYYELVFVNVGYFDFLHQQMAVDYYSDPYQINTILKNEGNQDYFPYSYFFSDDLFDGQEVDFKLQLKNSVYGGDIRGNLIGFPENGKYVIFRNISHSYYEYLKAWNKHRYTLNLGNGLTNLEDATLDGIQRVIFAPDPYPMYSNVKNGLGVLVGANTQIIKLQE